jgi:hypothetical protein
MAVWNKKVHGIPYGAVYIGRGSKWGNPFVLGRDGTRDEVCDKYEAYMEAKIESGEWTLEEIAALADRDLVCFCAPQRCHGHSLEKKAIWARSVLEETMEYTDEYPWLDENLGF